VSHAAGDFAPLANPVFSDLPAASSLAYLRTIYNGEGGAGHHAALTALGFTLSWSRLDTLYAPESDSYYDPGARFYSAGRGFFFGNTFGFGAIYTAGRGGLYNDYRSWTLGLLLRPSRWLSLGYVSRDINEPEVGGASVARSDVYSASLRPWRHHITLSADMTHAAGSPWGDAVFLYSLELVLARDIALHGAVDSDRNLSFGARIPLDLQAREGISALALNYHGASPRNGAALSGFGASITAGRYGRPVLVPREIVKIDLKGALGETPVRKVMGRQEPVYFDVLDAIARAGETPSVGAIILTIDNPRLGFARIQELREEILKFREGGKKVYAILVSSGNSSYYLASAADRVYFNPAETFMLTGLSAQVYFFRELLDKIGIKFESVRKGRYKFFNEVFTSRVMSRDYRDSLIDLLTSLNGQFTGGIAASRRMALPAIEEMFRRVMVSSDEALAAGFVDALMYPDPAERDIVQRTGRRSRVVAFREFISRERLQYRWGPVPEIAVIHVEGAIVRGSSEGRGPLSPDSTGDETYKKLLAEALSDQSVKGAVIRVNSGGGSAVASELMHHYLLETRGRFRKPVVFSFGDIAASGGYYIACTGDGIFAMPGTLTGSIGVISGRPSFKRLYEKIGINKEAVKLDELADIFTEARDMTDREREIFQKNVDFIYERFTKVVREGRKIEAGKIPDVAEGRVWTGAQAKEKQLVDTMGSLMRAVEHVRGLAGITGEYAVRHLPHARLPLGAELFSMAGSDTGTALPESIRKAAAGLRELELLYDRKEAALYLFPYRIVIE
jgi:protease-4